MVRPDMEVSATTQAPSATDADTVAIGTFKDEEPTAGAPDELRELLSDGEASRAFKALALAHSDGKRWLSVGLGPRADFTAESARVAAAVVRERARELSARELCWLAPADTGPEIAGALVEGTVLADYAFERHKSAASLRKDEAERKPKHLERLVVSCPQDCAPAVEQAAVVAEAANAARDLQNRPANDLTPTALGEHALALASELDGLSVEVEGREGIVARKMGAFASVARGSDEPPALITLRYDGPGAQGPLLGFVGKAVTFDSGGISLKPGAKMSEMKFDMSGGAAVIEAVAAIARLALPVRVLGVVGATENLPSGHATKPGDIVTAANGKTIEVNNTDAEGRLVLADCLSYAADQGAQMLVDLATLTGAVIIALGSEFAAVFSNDDALAGQLVAAGTETGEKLWRMPMADAYDKQIDSDAADMKNISDGRGAGSAIGAVFLKRFVKETKWAHVDIAGVAWSKKDSATVPKGATAFGVRLLDRFVADTFEH